MYTHKSIIIKYTNISVIGQIKLCNLYTIQKDVSRPWIMLFVHPGVYLSVLLIIICWVPMNICCII
jgi:hypothetical protein